MVVTFCISPSDPSWKKVQETRPRITLSTLHLIFIWILNIKLLLSSIQALIMSGITRKWVVKQVFQGMPKKEDFEIIEEQLPPLKDGGKMHASHRSSVYSHNNFIATYVIEMQSS